MNKFSTPNIGHHGWALLSRRKSMHYERHVQSGRQNLLRSESAQASSLCPCSWTSAREPGSVLRRLHGFAIRCLICTLCLRSDKL
ncbi:hypothetical protein BDW62DRAFT_159465 [Aspergillus aurantiobrunneus]